MKFLILLVIFGFCECKLKSVYVDQNFDDFNKNYWDQESYEDVTMLDIVRAYGYKPNQETSVKFDFLKKFGNLESLYVRTFKFDTIEKINFANELKRLYLSSNELKTLRLNFLYNLENLESLDMDNNQIEILCKGLLRKNKKLQRILFSKNKIKRIPETFFDGLKDLEHIEFHENQIEYLPHNLFVDNRKLDHVDFYENKITKMHPDIFTGLNPKTKNFYGSPCAVGGPFSNSNLENCFSEWRYSTAIESDNGKLMSGQKLFKLIF